MFHGIYGLSLAWKSRYSPSQFPYFENLKYILQRLSGIGLLLFIPAHLLKAKILPTLDGHPADFAHMAEAFSEPLTLIVYILGVLGVAYHIGNGLWQFSIGWGLTVTEAAMKKMQVVSILVFLAISAMGYAAIGGFLMSH